jgi:prepilin-type N-terminal cleavage/methylation domain-containing protein
MQNSDSRRKGFTLVELLVVIAIIVVLAAIALPVFNGARKKARERACMANMYQLAQAVRMYRMDMGLYPGPYDPVTGTGGLNDLYPAYLGSRAVFICPSDEMESGADYAKWQEKLLAYAGTLSMYEALDSSGEYWLKTWKGDNPTTVEVEDDPTFFSEHYSSYGTLYNWCGYVNSAKDYSILNAGSQEIEVGESLAYWYIYHLWDPEEYFTYMGQTLREGWNGAYADEVRSLLYLHLMQQCYCPEYVDDLTANPDDPTISALTDALGRRMWDYADASYYPYGMPSAAFPGLVNINAPENTVITRCFHHRNKSSDVATKLDIILRLDGSCTMVNVNYDWARQPQQAQ